MQQQSWLADRIWDIMHLKKYSLRKLFPLAGMNSAMELQRYLDGKSYITPTVLKNIATGLGISVERIEQTDYPGAYEELRATLKNGQVSEQTLQLAEKILNLAAGVKEKVDACRDLGWAFYHQNRFEDALEAWQNAYKLACMKDTRKKGKVIDEGLLFRSVLDLTVYYIERKVYDRALKLLDDSQPVFLGDVEKLGLIHHQRGLCLYKLGEREAARSHYLIAYECYKNMNDRVKIGRILGNIADIDYHAKDYHKAKEWLQMAQLDVRTDTPISQAIIDKDFARVLIQLGEVNHALQVIDRRLDLIDHGMQNIRPELIGKLFLMKADIMQDSTIAEKIMNLGEISRELRCNAADILTTVSIKKGDSESASKYYRIVKENLVSGIEDYRLGEWF